MPGLAKWGRRAEISGVKPVEDFENLDWGARGDPGMRRGCNGPFPGSRGGIGAGMVEEGEWMEEDQRAKAREGEDMGVFEKVEGVRYPLVKRKWSNPHWAVDKGNHMSSSIVTRQQLS